MIFTLYIIINGKIQIDGLPKKVTGSFKIWVFP